MIESIFTVCQCGCVGSKKLTTLAEKITGCQYLKKVMRCIFVLKVGIVQNLTALALCHIVIPTLKIYIVLLLLIHALNLL